MDFDEMDLSSQQEMDELTLKGLDGQANKTERIKTLELKANDVKYCIFNKTFL